VATQTEQGRAQPEAPVVRRAPAFPPERILMAPGPSNVHPRVLQALVAPLVGHRDPTFLAIMDEVTDLLRILFQTRNRATFALPGTGGSGMEAALLNLLEPEDTVVVGRAGFFADRMVGIAERIASTRVGGQVIVVDAPWGQSIPLDQLAAAVRQHRPRVLAVVHGETSTGVEQPLVGLAEVCRDFDCFLAVDAVASLGGSALPVDDLGIDICYSGSQKCLSAPPGLAPITVSDRALEAIERRRTPVSSWYLDLGLHTRFWDEHVYHHTAPVLNVYALREALRMIVEEGIEARVARHARHARALCAGLEALGLELFVDEPHRLAPVTTVLVPEGVSDAVTRSLLLDEFNIEIGGGLGDYVGRMWRIGVMGHSAHRSNIMLLLTALEHVLRRQGFHPTASGAPAAESIYG
jgi:alanine-glyoxylate transaminase / serine-glyoxylate transaminase / serine-pyruvate transaminase